MASHLFTSESVSEGHPDKLADQISDAILDAALVQAGPDAQNVRSACETLLKGNLLAVAGEMRLVGEGLDYLTIAKKVTSEIGYVDASLGFDPQSCVLVDALTAQSADIAQGVDGKEGTGAGDQGMMFGYACNETKSHMPLPITVAHALMMRQAKLRRSGSHDWLRPDAKAQVTVRYTDSFVPEAITDVVLSTQHASTIKNKPYSANLKKLVRSDIIEPVLAEYDIPSKGARCIINPTGQFIQGGPQADAGLTGRKIIVDTYGGSAPHGGGAFSGKDPSKVDRSAAYATRWLAKQVVASKLATHCLVQLSYAIGMAEPVSLMVNTYGTGKLPDDQIAARIKQSFPLTPDWIIKQLKLLDPRKRPVYRKTAAYGHFGRDDLKLSWEQVDRQSAFFRWCKSQ